MTSCLNRTWLGRRAAAAHLASCFAACVAITLTLAACSKPEAVVEVPLPTAQGNTLGFPGNKDPLDIRTVVVGSEGDQKTTVTGRLGWDEDRTARIFAPFSGRIERLRVSVGDRVRKGQALADVTSGDIGQAQAEYHKANADLALATASATRIRELVTDGIVARKDLAQAEADLARGNAEKDRTRAKLAQYGVSADAVTQGFSLVSPVDGTVVERNANAKGEVRSDVQGAPLFVISNSSSLWASLDVGETQLSRFKPGLKLDLQAVAWPDESFAGTVLTLGESVDPATRMIKVRLRVPNEDRRLKAEMYVSATLKQTASLPSVPTDAVYAKGNESFAFVHTGPGKYERRAVKVRTAGPKTWLVLDGLQNGDRVVVGGGVFLDQALTVAQR